VGSNPFGVPGFTITKPKISDIASNEFRVMLTDLGVSISIGATTTGAMLTVDDQVAEGESGFQSGAGAGVQKRGEVIARQIVATVLTDDFNVGELAIDATATINDGGFAGNYVVSKRLLSQHAGLSLTKLFLRGA
jgi:butyrate kinase